ncbi:MAG: inositol monophosphatase family protein [Candidatus Thorarchaeota archaeon]
MSTKKRRRDLLTQILQKAIEITQWFRKHSFQSYVKQDDSPVTLADFASQIFIISKLKEFFPDDSIIAEEKFTLILDNRAEQLINQCFQSLNININLELKESINYGGTISDYIWTVDPIDGTLGFQQGLSYAIGIGYMVKGDLLLSAIGVPNYNEKGNAIFFAESGNGAEVCYKNKSFDSIYVSKKDSVEHARICISLHYNKPWVFDFVKKAGINHSIQIDSMLKFCMIADGSADLYIKPMDMQQSYSWDYLPGTLLVKEAGGNVTDFNNNEIKFIQEKCVITSPGILSSNGHLHYEALQLLKDIKKL